MRTRSGCRPTNTWVKKVPYESPYTSTFLESQRLDHRCQVVGRQRGRVVVGPLAELGTARSGRIGVRDLQVLQQRAVDRLGPARPSLVHEEQVATLQQRGPYILRYDDPESVVL